MAEQLDVWVKRAIADKDEAFWQIYRLKWRDVLYTTNKLLNNEQDAADAAQEAFIRAYKNIEKLKKPEYFNSWLYRIVVNVCNDSLKKTVVTRSKEVAEVPLDLVPDENRDTIPEEALDQVSDRQDLIAAVDELSPDLKTAVILHYYQHMSYKEIAAATGISRAGVETRLRRARAAMKKHVLQVRKSEAIASAMVAAPIVANAFSADAQRYITPEMGESLRTSLCATGLVSLLGAGTTAGGTGAAATGAGAAGATAGHAATQAGAGVLGKILMGSVAAITAVGVGAGTFAIVAASTQPEPPPAPQEIAATAKTPATEKTRTLIGATTPEPAPATPTESPQQEETPRPATQPPTQAEPEPAAPTQPAIETLADMIGAKNATLLQSVGKSSTVSRRSAARALFSRVGLKAHGEQDGGDALYVLYVLEKQDKRLTVIERTAHEGGGYGLSYSFGSKSRPVPQTWELMFEY